MRRARPSKTSTPATCIAWQHESSNRPPGLIPGRFTSISLSANHCCQSGEAPAPVALERLIVSRAPLPPDPNDIRELADRISSRPGIIVCGEQPMAAGFAEAVGALAGQLNSPVLAEPLSNLRFGGHDRSRLCVRYNLWLNDPQAREAARPEWVLRFGGFPVTRHLQALVCSGTGLHALIEPWPRWTDPPHQLTHVLRADPVAFCSALLAEAPQAAPASWQAGFAARDATMLRENGGHIAALIEELPAGTAVFVGNSLAIRELDSHSGSADKSLLFYGNRGASGIDGNISTAMGIAAVHDRVVALLGDLTCQHDLGGLALAQGRNAVIVAVNNGGGGIFDHLPQVALPEFSQGWRTPQQIDFEHAALTFGLTFASADDDDAFRQALRHALEAGGPHLIERRLA